MEVRVSVLGHFQRGGHPSAADRILACRFAEAAWEAITDPHGASGVLGISAGKVSLNGFAGDDRQSRMDESGKLYLLQKALSKWQAAAGAERL